MKTLSYQQVMRMQIAYGYDKMQALINEGAVWQMEGSMGRAAMDMLNAGVCYLPKQPKRDAYGNRIPARQELKAGTKGTFQNAARFWTKVSNGEVFLEQA